MPPFFYFFQTLYSAFRVCIRTVDHDQSLRCTVFESAIPQSSSNTTSKQSLQPGQTPIKNIVNFLCPELDVREFKQVQSIKSEKTGKRLNPLPSLLKLDELRSCSRKDTKRRKCGILLQLPGQTSEREMYNNKCGTDNFKFFLDFLAKRVPLRGFDGYNGGLDVKRDQTGKHSYYTRFQGYEIMFHVSTLLQGVCYYFDHQNLGV